MLEEKERWINITGSASEDFYTIKVVNHGAGIPDEVADRLFEPFFTTKEVGKGTGLGLSLSKTLMERSKGNIFYIKNMPNTTFELKIPLA